MSNCCSKDHHAFTLS
ncbi:hypothetical protein D043_0290A, partial [Vibrio parahaemolyticus EKP-021]